MSIGEENESRHTLVPGPGSSSKARQEAVGEEQAGVRLDKALALWLPNVPRTRLFRLIRKGEVRVNRKRAAPEQRLAVGDVVRVPPVRELSAADVAAGDMPAAAQAGGDTARADSRRTRIPLSLQELIQRSIIHED